MALLVTSSLDEATRPHETCRNCTVARLPSTLLTTMAKVGELHRSMAAVEWRLGLPRTLRLDRTYHLRLVMNEETRSPKLSLLCR